MLTEPTKTWTGDFLDPNIGKWHTHGQEIVSDGEGGTIEIEYVDMPARFWRFTIHHDAGHVTVLETGSGTLAEYLPTARKFASGMLAVVS